MPLHIETVVDSLASYLQLNFAGALSAVLAEGGQGIPGLIAPSAKSYFIGEQSRYHGYEAPAFFFVTPRTNRPAEGQRDEWSNVLYQEHRILLDILIEAQDEETLTRGAWRMAQAVDMCLHDAEIMPLGVTARATKIMVPTVDYGQIFVREGGGQRCFRKDIWVELLVKHWDQLTALPIQIAAGNATVVTLGELAMIKQVAASTVDSTLTTTNATTVLSYTHGAGTGIFSLWIYYRVTIATTLTITVNWQDVSSTQSVTAVSGQHAVDSYILGSTVFSVTQGTPITVIATAGTANAVAVSAVLEKLA